MRATSPVSTSPRRALRILLLIAGANALALSVFGTVQKLAHATGLFFGAVPSPQPFFFASFIYHNHWGALIVLMSAISIGLARYYGRRREGRDVFHTPAFLIVVAVLFFAITVPLSGSRSCSMLLALLLGGAFLGWTRRLIRARRGHAESIAPPLLAAAAAIILAILAIWYLAGDVITSRIAKTGEQLVDMRERGDIGGRNILYGDTIRMARDRPLLGWGMASYPHIFWIYNTQEPNPLDHIPVYYHDAHSDWLQAFAEHGVVGASLLALCALVPLWGLKRANLKGPLIRYPLLGCALLLLYAWIEFPFGNVAVVLAWWYCYFCGVSYAILSKAIKEARDAPEASAPIES